MAGNILNAVIVSGPNKGRTIGECLLDPHAQLPQPAAPKTEKSK